MKEGRLKKFKNLILPFISLIIFLALWSVFAAVKNLEIILPRPLTVLKDFFNILGTAEFYRAVSGTLYRTAVSFIFAFVSAIILGIFAGLFKSAARFLSPLIVILRATPTMSIILLTLIFMTSKTSPVLIGFLIIFPIMYESFYNALVNVDKELIEMSRVYKVRNSDMIRFLYIPSMLPTVFSTVKSSISLNVKIIIAAEVLAQTKDSMGFMMQQAKIYIDTPLLIAWTAAAVILSYMLELLIRLIALITIKKGDI